MKNLANEVADAHRKLINDKTPVTSDRLKLALNQFLQKDKKNHTDIVNFAENWVEAISSTKGGIRETTISKKWELITTHTARRSFASNAYLQNVPTISIMKITGHRTEKVF